ncbi:MAG: hypothetical protein ACE5I5_12955 [Candidatus Heimdallarchaeota archaeon]
MKKRIRKVTVTFLVSIIWLDYLVFEKIPTADLAPIIVFGLGFVILFLNFVREIVRVISFNFLFVIGIILAVIGIIFYFLIDPRGEQIGYGLIGIGVIIAGLGAVGIKAEERGFDFWALSAFISYLGILLFMAPFILAIFDIDLSQWALFDFIPLELISMVLGVVFTIFGVYFEESELNIRFSAYLQELREILSGVSRLRIFVAVALEVINTIFVAFRNKWEPFQRIGDVRKWTFLGLEIDAFDVIIFVMLILIVVVIVFGRVKKFFTTLLGGLKTYIQYIGRSIKLFPTLFVRALKGIGEHIVGAFKVVWEKFKDFGVQLVHHSYSITLVVGVIVAYVGFTDLPQVSLIIIFVFLAAVKIGVTYSSGIVRGIRRLNSALYTSSFTAKRAVLHLVRRKIMCPNCSTLINLSEILCSNCGAEVPRCMICRIPIKEDQEIAQCPSCAYPAHKNHWDEWILMRKSCPRCRNPIEKN